METDDIPKTQENSHVEITHEDRDHHLLRYHFEFIPQGQAVNQAYCVEILMGYVKLSMQKGLNFGPANCILHHTNVSAHKALSVKQFLAQKSITEMEHPPQSPDFPGCLFPKTKSVLEGQKFQDI
jgi:hypothetical protein